jgi:uncharacterized protein
VSNRIYLDAQTLLEDAFRLAANVVNSGYRPTHVIALWRGGVPIGVAVQEFLRQCGIAVDHSAIRTTHYAAAEKRDASVSIHGLDELAARCHADNRVLLVDDVHDTGLTVRSLIEQWQRAAGGNTPREIRIAVPYYKPRFNQTGRAPDYWLHETDAWLMYPHSLEGMSAEDIANRRPELAAILAAAATVPLLSPDASAETD